MPARINGIGWVFLLAGTGLFLVCISVFGNVLTSFSEEGDAVRYSLSNYAELFSQDTLGAVTGRTVVLGFGTVFWMFLFAFPFAWLLAKERLSKRYLSQATLTAKIYDPKGARDAGFLDEVVEADKLREVALERAAKLAELPAKAYADMKQGLRGESIAAVLAGLGD